MKLPRGRPVKPAQTIQDRRTKRQRDRSARKRAAIKEGRDDAR